MILFTNQERNVGENNNLLLNFVVGRGRGRGGYRGRGRGFRSNVPIQAAA